MLFIRHFRCFLLLNILVKYELFVCICVCYRYSCVWSPGGLPYILLFSTLPPCVLRQALLLDMGLMRLYYWLMNLLCLPSAQLFHLVLGIELEFSCLCGSTYQLSYPQLWIISPLMCRTGEGMLSVEKLCSWQGLSIAVGSVEMLCLLHLHQI